ncbi:hypothetical protein [Kitasatospora sp. NPDC059673]
MNSRASSGRRYGAGLDAEGSCVEVGEAAVVCENATLLGCTVQRR